MTTTTATSPVSALALAVGDRVILDGTSAFEVVRVGRGMKQRAVTYRPCGGRSDDTFTITHRPESVLDRVAPVGCGFAGCAATGAEIAQHVAYGCPA